MGSLGFGTAQGNPGGGGIGGIANGIGCGGPGGGIKWFWPSRVGCCG